MNHGGKTEQLALNHAFPRKSFRSAPLRLRRFFALCPCGSALAAIRRAVIMSSRIFVRKSRSFIIASSRNHEATHAHACTTMYMLPAVMVTKYKIAPAVRFSSLERGCGEDCGN